MATTELKTTEEKKTTNSLFGRDLADRYDAASAALDKIASERPADYSSKYQPQIDMAMDKVLNRPDFKYNVNEDALYQQYKDRFSTMGRQAMQDTMGQASALTGGYGSTYGQRVGQQTYDQYMTALTDKIPELQQMARDQYDRDYAYDKDRLGVLNTAEATDYGRWGDTINLWQTDRGFAADQYNSALSQGMAAAEQNYARLTALMQLGYTPTDDELYAAGLTPAQAAAMMPKVAAGGGSSRNKSGSGSKPTSTYTTADILAGVPGAIDAARDGNIKTTSGSSATRDQIADAVELATNKKVASGNSGGYWRNK